MAIVHIHEAKTHFSKLIQRALAGEEIIVAKGNTPLIKLVPLPEAKVSRTLGRRKGFVQSIARDFDAPLEEFDEFFQ
ncbi:type II toxin-antitoxin system prevent-host-death family antitoxin [bacterium]|jgi:prevent-host-death family protein|nr:type II toxin-antitoxin system prevent-host-death family antitoxin [bacterium]MDA7645018.1 type II toxin-antitoxin system prevent-host-death family antitoxin [bacterium]MDA7667368.1 type II toxin-antitoxin system prevent-host-death family antitoxin [bacterium]